MFKIFWNWYKKNLFANQIIVALLFSWQLLHLYWLTTHVLSDKILGYSLFNPTEFYQFLLVVADYFEIPALIGGTLLYAHSLKEGGVNRSLIFIVLINSQWLHLFWITDEFVINQFRDHHELITPIWLAWAAIFIDYLELPVIYDTIKRVLKKIINPELSQL